MSVFISYRRDGGLDLAGRIHDHLKQDGYECFFDVESMRNGKFGEQIYNKISASDDFLLILSPFALDRCGNENDWVRLEIKYALEHNKNIVLIQMPKFVFPPKNKLPNDIQSIVEYQALTPTAELFEAFIKKLEKFLASMPIGKVPKNIDCPVRIDLDLYHLAISDVYYHLRNQACPAGLQGKYIGKKFQNHQDIEVGFFPYLKTTIINVSDKNIAIQNSSGTLDAVGLFYNPYYCSLFDSSKTVKQIGLGLTLYDSDKKFSQDQDHYRVLGARESISTFLCGHWLISILQAMHEKLFQGFILNVDLKEYFFNLSDFPQVINYANKIIGFDFQKLHLDDIDYREKWLS